MKQCCKLASKDVAAACGTHAVGRCVLHWLQTDAAHNARWCGCRGGVACFAAALCRHLVRTKNNVDEEKKKALAFLFLRCTGFRNSDERFAAGASATTCT